MEEFPKEPSPEDLELSIEKLLEQLRSYAELFDQLTPELQEEWYNVEMEAEIAKDRKTAKTNLEKFLEVIKEL